MRQVEAEDGKHYVKVGKALGYSALIGLAIGWIICQRMNAETLPIWSCHQTLMLIMHLPMLNVNMPGSAAIVLTEAAKILRLEMIPLRRVLDDNFNVGGAGNALNMIMEQNGYAASSILLNLAPIIAIYTLLLLAQIIVKCMSSPYSDPNKVPRPMINGHSEARTLTASQKALNVLFRFQNTMLLEFFICTLINMKAGVSDKSNDFESTSRIIAIFYLVIIFLFLGMLFLLTLIESDVERDKNELPTAALDCLYTGMDNKRRTPANILLIAQVFRAVLFAIIMVMLQDAPGFQIQLLIISSWFITAILFRTKPYTRSINFFTVAFFEFIYVWCCALTLMFSPEYIYRSYSISKNMGFFICLVAFIVLGVGLVLIIGSVVWQSQYYKRI